MKSKICYILCSSVIICNFLAVSSVFAQPSLEVKALLREGMKECRQARTLRRSDLELAQEKFKAYIVLLQQAIQLDEKLLDSNDSTVKRVLGYCNEIKADLVRAEALPLFERGLSECRQGRVMLSSGLFDEAKTKNGLYVQYKESALSLTESVLEIYENSYELKMCEELSNEIQLAEVEFKKQATVLAENQRRVIDLIGMFNEAVNQCRGMQNIINDEARYTSQTAKQVKDLLTVSRKTKATADGELKAIMITKNKPDERATQRIAALTTEFSRCESGIPDGIAKIESSIPIKTTGSKTTKVASAQKKPVNSDYEQIVGAQAAYPMMALRRKIQGRVLVRFTVTKTGDVDNIQIVESKPSKIFDKAALKAVSKYKFKPRIVNGEAVDTLNVERPISFKLSQ